MRADTRLISFTNPLAAGSEAGNLSFIVAAKVKVFSHWHVRLLFLQHYHWGWFGVGLKWFFFFLIWIFPQVGMTMSEQHFRVWGKAAAGRGEVLEPWALDDLRATWPRLTAQDHHERRDCNFIFFLFQSFVENLVIFWTLEITQNAWKAFFRHASTLVLQGGWLWYGGNDDDDVSTRCKVWTTSEGVKVWKCKVWMTIEGVKVWKCKVQSMNENDQRGF